MRGGSKPLFLTGFLRVTRKPDDLRKKFRGRRGGWRV